MPMTPNGRRLALGAGVVLGLGAAIVAGQMTGQAGGQAGSSASGVTVSARQLLINQRISQAAIRRSNTALQRLDAVEPRVSAAEPRWAVVTGAGALTRARGATAATRTAFGRYRVTFDRSVVACALSATIAVTDPSEFVLVDRVPTLGLDPAAPDVVTVRIYQASNPANSEDAPFHLTVLC
jgi:hypothetical protein